MAKYVFQLRRGERYVDEYGATLLNDDGTPVKDEWTTYTAQPNHQDPLAGELVLEYEVYPDGKKIPRLKIGDGENTFADLEYMSVDSFILPKPISVTLDANKWVKVENGDTNALDTYSQTVTVTNAVITPNSKVDLQPTIGDLCKFSDWGLTLTTENVGGMVTVYAVGVKPSLTFSVQATVSEVIINE